MSKKRVRRRLVFVFLFVDTQISRRALLVIGASGNNDNNKNSGKPEHMSRSVLIRHSTSHMHHHSHSPVQVCCCLLHVFFGVSVTVFAMGVGMFVCFVMRACVSLVSLFSLKRYNDRFVHDVFLLFFRELLPLLLMLFSVICFVQDD